MRLEIILCLFAILPVVLTQLNTCQDYSSFLMGVVGGVKHSSDGNLNATCDIPSKKAILQYMINTLNVLSFRLQMPCVFTFQPLPFSSSCAALDMQNPVLLSMLDRLNSALNSMCDKGCPIPQAANTEIVQQKTDLENILAALLNG